MSTEGAAQTGQTEAAKEQKSWPVGTTSTWEKDHPITDEYMLTGKGTPDMEVVSYGGEIAAAQRRSEEGTPKDVEDFTDSEYERFLKDGTLPEKKQPASKAAAEAKPEDKRTPDANEPAKIRDFHRYEEHERKQVHSNVEKLVKDGTINPQLNAFMANALSDPGLQNPYAILKHVVENPQVLRVIHRLKMAGDDAKVSSLIYRLDMEADGKRGPKEVTGAKRPPSEVGARGAVGRTEEEEENALLRKAAAGDPDATSRYIESANARDVRKRRATIGVGRR